MFRNYLITAWRHMLRNARFSAINIFGLAIGLASCILIMLYVKAETGFDKWIPDSDRIVRLHTAYHVPGNPPFLTVRSAGRMMEAVRDYASSQVEDGVRLIHFETAVQHNGDAFNENMTIVDGSFFNVFALPFVQGSAQTSFNKPNDLIITEEIAMKYFGTTDVLGKTLSMCCLANQIVTLPITGVVKDFPDQTHLDLDLILRLQPAIFENDTSVLHTWNSLNVYTYFKMRKGVTIDQFQQRLSYWVNNESQFSENYGIFADGNTANAKPTDFIKHKLMALEDLHLHAKRDAGSMGDLKPLGDIDMIYAFTFVAVLILIIACFNFMNLSTARATQRAREVAMRKVLGASRGQVALQFLGESIVMVLISLLFALVIVELTLPLYSQAIGQTLQLKIFSELPLFAALIALGIFIGLLSGLYPALVLSRFLPSQILKSNKSSESSGSYRLRLFLVVLQFAISIILIICTSVIYTQTRFAQSIDLGYKIQNKLVLGIGAARDQLDSLEHSLAAIPGVESVVFSSEAPTQDNENNMPFKLLAPEQKDDNIDRQLLNYYHMGFGFFEDYDVQPLAGRLFSREFGSDEIKPDQQGNISHSIILNQSAVNKLGIPSPSQAIGKTLTRNGGTENFTIIGVIPDLYFRSIKFGIRPSVYMVDPGRFNVATLSVSTDQNGQVISQIEQVWKQYVPNRPMELSFLDEMMAAQYEDERVQTLLFSVFSVLAIAIACLGLFGLAAFTTQRRTKEIGVRKVMGASVRNIVSLLIWQFSKPVLLANVIAWPIASYAMITWLERFPYRIDFIYLLPICVAVGASLMIIAWFTVGGNAAKVARANPIIALRQD